MYKNKLFASIVIMASFLMMISFSANSANFYYCGNSKKTWKSKEYTLHNTVTPGTVYYNSIKKMMQKWNKVRSSDFAFYNRDHSGSPVGIDNGLNDFYFADLSKYGETTLGIAIGITHCKYSFIWGYFGAYLKEIGRAHV